MPQANDPVFLICSFWTYWVQFVFGMGSFMVGLILRLVRIYVVLRFEAAITGWKILLWFCGLLCPFLLYSIVTSALSVDGPISNEYGMKVCFMQDPPLYALFVILFVYVLTILVLDIYSLSLSFPEEAVFIYFSVARSWPS